MVNYRQSLAFDRPYLSSCNGHCDRWLFQEIFFLNIIFISQKFYWIILNVLSWSLNTFYKTQRKSMFCFYLFSFYLFFSSSLCVLTVSIFLYFFTACKHTGWLCFLFACHFAITLCNNTLHLLQLDRFIKTNPYMDFLCYLYIFHVNFLGEAYIFLTLDLPQLN